MFVGWAGVGRAFGKAAGHLLQPWPVYYLLLVPLCHPVGTGLLAGRGREVVQGQDKGTISLWPVPRFAQF